MKLTGISVLCIIITIVCLGVAVLSFWGFRGATVYAKFLTGTMSVIILVLTNLAVFKWFNLVSRCKSLRETIYMQNGEIDQDVVATYRMLKSKYPLAVAAYESQYFHDNNYLSSFELVITISSLSEKELATREQEEWRGINARNNDIYINNESILSE